VLIKHLGHVHLSFSVGNVEQHAEDLGLQLKLLTMLDNPAVIVAAAASGDVGTLRDFLTKHPTLVNDASNHVVICFP
jgi:hypothetical protein